MKLLNLIFFLSFLSFVNLKLKANFKPIIFYPNRLNISPSLSRNKEKLPLLKASPDEKDLNKTPHLSQTYYFVTYKKNKKSLPQKFLFFEVELFEKMQALLKSASKNKTWLKLFNEEGEFKLEPLPKNKMKNIFNSPEQTTNTQ